MGEEKNEVECPLCDRKVPLDATKCPGCGADFSLSDMEDLEKVVSELDRPTAETTVVSEAPAAPAEAPAAPSPQGSAEKKKGMFSKLFGRR